MEKAVGTSVFLSIAGGIFLLVIGVSFAEATSLAVMPYVSQNVGMSSDPVVIAYSHQKMVIISSTYFICGINEIMGAALRGMGRPTIPTIATLIFMCAIRFVLVYAVFPHFRNLTFLYLIWPISYAKNNFRPTIFCKIFTFPVAYFLIFY